MRRLIALSMLALFTAGAVLAVRWLPWWGLALGGLLFVLAAKYVMKRLVRKLFLMPFRAKGAVLKGASVRLHSISPAKLPATEEAATASRESRGHYVVEVTITPRESRGPFGLWEPGELRLVRPESVLRPESDEHDDEDSSCEVAKIQIHTDGQWADDEGMKYGGPQRLRLYLMTQSGVRELKFRYYFEEFGVIKLPQGTPAELHSPVR